MKTNLRYVSNVIRMVFLQGDMLPIRIVLANASFMRAISLGIDYDAFSRPAYGISAQIAPQWAWAVLFLLHGIGEYWRVIDPVHRPRWALLTNAYGFLIWFVATVGVTMSIGSFSPTLAMDWSMLLAAGWMLFRTGRNTSSIPE